MAFLVEPLSERSGAAKCVNNWTCRDIQDEQEHLLGNDGRLGSFPDPTAMLAGPGGTQTLRWHLCLLPAL